MNLPRKPTFNFRNLKKPSQIYRKAAEVLQYDLERGIGAVEGCCSAFSEIICATWDKIYNAPSDKEPAIRNKMYAVQDVIEDAAEEFARYFKPESRPLYWFGTTFDRDEQEHRITALLLMADIAESQGN